MKGVKWVELVVVEAVAGAEMVPVVAPVAGRAGWAALSLPVPGVTVCARVVGTRSRT